MHSWAYHLTTLLLAGAAFLLFVTAQAPWVSTADASTRVGLLGVSRVGGRCRWFDAPPISPDCTAAPAGRTSHALVRTAPFVIAFAIVSFVLAAFAHLRRGSGLTGTGLAPFALLSATSVAIAALLLTRNVGRALAPFATSPPLSGPGLAAAWSAAALLVVAAALSRYSFSVDDATPIEGVPHQ